MRIDTHQHFWRYNDREYGWMTDAMEKLRRDYLPLDLLPLMSAAGIDGTIAVQARQCLEETRWLLELADRYSFVRAVVGWVDLCDGNIVEQLEQFSQYPKFRGVRHVVHDEPDDAFMLREGFLRGLGYLKRFGLTYDLLLFPRHLPIAYDVVRRFPEQPFVLDHIAKPPIRARDIEPWARDIKRLAQFPNVYCKLSGLVTEAEWEDWRTHDFGAYLDVVLEAFGSQRLMIGSDWPVCTLAADYTSVISLLTEYVSRQSRDEQDAILEKNPVLFYSIPSSVR